MKETLLEVIQCEQCGGELNQRDEGLVCSQCEHVIPLPEYIPLFSSVNQNIQPSLKEARGPNMGTPWRQANWQFLKTQLLHLPSDALILDVGAGRGDFFSAYAGRDFIALDVYPYPEVDIVCDLTTDNPFRPASFDAIILFNVMEHVYDTHALLQSLAAMLKPNGVLLVTIPFMDKMHQVPVDFVRYTHYSLKRLGDDHGLKVEHLEGYYDPVFLLGEGIGNLKWRILPAIRGFRHYVGRTLLWGIQILAEMMKHVTGPGWVQIPADAKSLAPTGYHVVYRKVDLE